MADNLVDPQSAVNAALGGTVNPEPTPPTPTPPPPPIPATDPVTPPAPPTPPPNPPTPPEPVATAMSPDLPLAFAKPASDQKTEATTVPPAPTLPVEAPKKKGKLGVILAGILGLFIVLGGSVFGYLYYTENLPPSKSEIANIQTKYPDKASCEGACDAGRLLRWDAKNGRCEDSGKSCSGEGTAQQLHSYVVNRTYENCKPGSGFAWCDGCGGFCIAPIKETCNQMQVAKCGESPIVGASCSTTKLPGYTQTCECDGNGPYYFDATGICDSNDPKAKGTTDPKYYDANGLCAVAKMTNCATTGGAGGTGVSCDFTCDGNGCRCDSDRNGCQIYHWKCDRITDLDIGCQDGTPKIGMSASFNASCGSEQIDVVCHGTNVGFRSRVTDVKCGSPSKPPTVIPSPSPSPSPSTTTAMSCTGISKNVATPEIGDKVTFTCAGSTTPASLGSSLAYNFRYNINSGNWQTLANKTSTTAELSVDACGTYAVQCRACLTTAGTTTCDPVWQGATQ